MTITWYRARSNSRWAANQPRIAVSVDLLSVAVRTLAFVSQFQAAGAAFFVLLFGSAVPRSSGPIQRLGFWSALAAIALLAVHQCLEAARMGDGLSGLIDSHLELLAWNGRSGNATLIEMIGLGVIAFGMAQPVALAASIASSGAIVAACAAVLTGHTSVHPPRSLLAPLLAVHLVLVAFWFGALWPLIICCVRESRQTMTLVLQGFSSVAGTLVPCIAVAGLAMALILMPDSASWRTIYGSLVLVKIAAFVVLMILAAWNRWRAVPGSQGLRRSIAIEFGLMAVVFAATATMTTLYSPQ
jgi:putative copper export protein